MHGKPVTWTMSGKPRGCLTRLALGVLVLALVAGAGLIGLVWITDPWIYRVGGKQRLLPIWSGTGTADGPAGRYQVYVSFYPAHYGHASLPGVSVKGTGVICAPDGARYPARVRGGARGRIWSQMDGHAFWLEVYDRPVLWQTSSRHDWRPSLRFDGAWAGPELRMSDDGSLRNAFRADGSLNPRPASTPDKKSAVPITFVETGRWLAPDCPPPQR